MTADLWKRTIKRETKAVGTYRKSFDQMIDALSKILAERDRAYDQYLEEGAQTIVEKVSDRGAVNNVKNPLLVLWADLNRDALAYWRDLGLTPAGLKRINEEAMTKKSSGSALEEALKNLGT